MAVLSCPQCGAACDDGMHAAAWTCRRCKSVVRDEAASVASAQALAEGRGAFQRGDYVAALAQFERAMDAGTNGSEIVSCALIAIARTTDLSNLTAMSEKAEWFLAQMDGAEKEQDPQSAARTAESLNLLGATVCRAMAHHMATGDRAFFAHESTDRKYAEALRSEEYRNVLEASAFSIRHRPLDIALSQRIDDMVVGCHAMIQTPPTEPLGGLASQIVCGLVGLVAGLVLGGILGAIVTSLFGDKSDTGSLLAGLLVFGVTIGGLCYGVSIGGSANIKRGVQSMMHGTG